MSKRADLAALDFLSLYEMPRKTHLLLAVGYKGLKPA
jgi:hypothetical protein